MQLSSITRIRAAHPAPSVTAPRREGPGYASPDVISISRDAALRLVRLPPGEPAGLRLHSESIDTSAALLKGDPHIDLPLPGTPAPGSTDEATSGPADLASNPPPPPEQPVKANGVTEAQQVREDAALIQQLSARDVAVHAHEAAHIAVAGGLAGAPSYSYQMGPDGRSYAVGGEVSIDMSAGRTPEETMARARRIRAAATAPSDPSAQDLAVAASATAMEMRAAQELMQLRSRPPAGHVHTAHCAFCAKAVGSYRVASGAS